MPAHIGVVAGPIGFSAGNGELQRARLLGYFGCVQRLEAGDFRGMGIRSHQI